MVFSFFSRGDNWKMHVLFLFCRFLTECFQDGDAKIKMLPTKQSPRGKIPLPVGALINHTTCHTSTVSHLSSYRSLLTVTRNNTITWRAWGNRVFFHNPGSILPYAPSRTVTGYILKEMSHCISARGEVTWHSSRSAVRGVKSPLLFFVYTSWAKMIGLRNCCFWFQNCRYFFQYVLLSPFVLFMTFLCPF